MANGQVVTGFSKPYVAVYTNDETEVTYTNGQILARGVSVSLDVESSDDNNFFADNITAETGAGTFTSGTVTLTVDGLKAEAEKLLVGLPDADDDGFVAYGASQQIPYVGVGFVVRVQSGGVVSYIPIVLPKVVFNNPSLEAATQEDEIDWQTQELEGAILRDDTEEIAWKYRGENFATEALAEAAIKTKLQIAASAYLMRER